jgi:hypothetical protein
VSRASTSYIAQHKYNFIISIEKHNLLWARGEEVSAAEIQPTRNNRRQGIMPQEIQSSGSSDEEVCPEILEERHPDSSA